MGDHDKQLIVELDKDLKKDFQMKCAEEDLLMSSIVRSLIERWTYGDHFEGEEWMEQGSLREIRKALRGEEMTPDEAAELIRSHTAK